MSRQSKYKDRTCPAPPLPKHLYGQDTAPVHIRGKKLPVRIYGDKSLRRVSEPVQKVDSEVGEILADLIETMYAKDGVGLAAPQIGTNIRVFVVDPQWFETQERRPVVFINPKFLSMTGKETSEEGCLSLPDITGEVPRAKNIVIEAINEKGELVRHQASGLFARAIQHEFDHLDGVLFIDRISKLKLLSQKIKLRKLERQTSVDGVNTDENLQDGTAE